MEHCLVVYVTVTQDGKCVCVCVCACYYSLYYYRSGDRCDCNFEVEPDCPLVLIINVIIISPFKTFSFFSGLECLNRGACDCGTCRCTQPDFVPINNGTLYNVTRISATDPAYAIVV